MPEIEEFERRVGTIFEDKIKPLQAQILSLHKAVLGDPEEEAKLGKVPGGLRGDVMRNTRFRIKSQKSIKWFLMAIASIIISTIAFMIRSHAAGQDWYAFMGVDHWGQISHTGWAIPRWSPDGDSVAVKPDKVSADSLLAVAEADKAIEMLSLAVSKDRVSVWVDTTGVE